MLDKSARHQSAVAPRGDPEIIELPLWISISPPAVACRADRPPSDPFEPTSTWPSREQWSKHLREVRRIAGPEFADLVAMFESGSRSQMVRMHEALIAGKPVLLRSATRQLKNAAATLGVGLLAAACQRLENDLKVGRFARGPDLVKVIEISLDASITMLKLYSGAG